MKLGLSGTILAISAASGYGVPQLWKRQKVVDDSRAAEPEEMRFENLPDTVLSNRIFKKSKIFEVLWKKEEFRITVSTLNKLPVQTDFTNPEGILRLRDVFRKMGMKKSFSKESRTRINLTHWEENTRFSVRYFSKRPEILSAEPSEEGNRGII